MLPLQTRRTDGGKIGDNQIEMPVGGAALSRRYRHGETGAFKYPPYSEPYLGVAVDDQG
jgi:hypothetical protein